MCVPWHSKKAPEVLMGRFLLIAKSLIYLGTILQKLSENPPATPATMKKARYIVSRLEYTFNRNRKT